MKHVVKDDVYLDVFLVVSIYVIEYWLLREISIIHKVSEKPELMGHSHQSEGVSSEQDIWSLCVLGCWCLWGLAVVLLAHRRRRLRHWRLLGPRPGS